jgi:energy-converting hydrogenase Eha subunit E
MRFWLLDLPALIVTLIFRAYAVCLAAMAILCFGSVIYSLAALAFDWPPIW